MEQQQPTAKQHPPSKAPLSATHQHPTSPVSSLHPQTPHRCDKSWVDYKLEGGELVESTQEEDWRCAGDAFLGFGFELTQDEDNQQVCI